MQPPPGDRLFAVMSDGSQAITWGEMVVKRNRIAHSLANHLPSTIVAGAIYSTNSPAWAVSHEVCDVMGLRFSPINWHLVPDEIAYIVDDCDADVVRVAFASQSLHLQIRTLDVVIGRFFLASASQRTSLKSGPKHQK